MDIAGISMSFCLIFVTLFPLYLLCDSGDKVTQRFEQLGDAVYVLDWYKCPLDMQKDLGTVIALAQKRVFVQSFADTRSTREVFKKVKSNACAHRIALFWSI